MFVEIPEPEYEESGEGYILHNKDQIHGVHEKIEDTIHSDAIPIQTVTLHLKVQFTVCLTRQILYIRMERQALSMKKNNLLAVAATDRNGDGGHFFDEQTPITFNR